MNIFSINYLSSLSSYTSFVKENVLTTLNDQQKRIVLIAVTAFAALVTCFAIYRCCWRAKKDIVPVEKSLDTKIDNDMDSKEDAATDEKFTDDQRVGETEKSDDNALPIDVAAEPRKDEAGKAPPSSPKDKKDIDSKLEDDKGKNIAQVDDESKMVDEDAKASKLKDLKRSASVTLIVGEVITDNQEPINLPVETSGLSKQATITETTVEKSETSAEAKHDKASKIKKYKSIKTIEYPKDASVISKSGIFKGRTSLLAEGTTVYKDHVILEGSYDKNNKLTGQGKMIHPKNGTYEGIFENGELNGKGTRTQIIKASKSSEAYTVLYDGIFKNNKLNGPGKIVYPDQELEGLFINDKLNGQGTRKFKDGLVITGEFKDNCLHGHGKLTHPDGRIFEGEYKNNQLNGHGARVHADGSFFKGVFVNETLHGPNGLMILADKTRYEGTFANGRLNGPGKKTLPSGEIFEGTFANDELNGQGTKILSDKTKLEGEFKKGKLNGSVTITDKDGKVSITQYRDDTPVIKFSPPLSLNSPRNSVPVINFGEQPKQAPIKFKKGSDGEAPKTIWLSSKTLNTL